MSTTTCLNGDLKTIYLADSFQRKFQRKMFSLSKTMYKIVQSLPILLLFTGIASPRLFLWVSQHFLSGYLSYIELWFSNEVSLKMFPLSETTYKIVQSLPILLLFTGIASPRLFLWVSQHFLSGYLSYIELWFSNEVSLKIFSLSETTYKMVQSLPKAGDVSKDDLSPIFQLLW